MLRQYFRFKNVLSLEEVRDGQGMLVFWCNHGKHRSVAVAELMARLFDWWGIEVTIAHLESRCHCGCPKCKQLLEILKFIISTCKF